jgi:hypothetical protein
MGSGTQASYHMIDDPAAQPAVVVHLMGGLGNQLFQYAFARRLAHANNARLYLDASGYAGGRPVDPRQGIRAFELMHFNITGSVLQSGVQVSPGMLAWKRRLLKLRDYAGALFDRRRPYYMRRVVVEPPRNRFRFDRRAFDRVVTGTVYVRGFWQTGRYFSGIETILRRELTLRDDPDPPNAQMSRAIMTTASVAVHVRHGDNANAVARALGSLPREYYDRAMRAIVEEVAAPCFFVFSDDIPWARRFLGGGFPATYVDLNPPAGSHADLRLMSLCKHHIIANSTFGWWGAWLGGKEGQIVQAPRRYYQNIDQPNPDLYPADWRVLEV